MHGRTKAVVHGALVGVALKTLTHVGLLVGLVRKLLLEVGLGGVVVDLVATFEVDGVLRLVDELGVATELVAASTASSLPGRSIDALTPTIRLLRCPPAYSC